MVICVGARNHATYVADIKLIPRVGSSIEEVVRGGTRWRSGMQALTCHGHANLTWDRCSAETRLVLAILEKAQRQYSLKCKTDCRLLRV